MECGTVQFIVFLLIIILIKESLVQAEAISLEASPSTLHLSGDTLTISWRNLDAPTQFDWLGIYTPPESLDDHFIGYILLSSIEGWQGGNGTYAFPAVNMRAPYDFRLFRGFPPTSNTPLDEDRNPIPSIKELLAVSATVNFTSFNEPTQIHLALTSNPTEMRVIFVTKDLVNSFVKYGKASDKLFSSRVTEAVTYERKDMCDAPANTILGWREPGYFHSAVMIGLESGVRYYYQVGSGKLGWSTIYSFVASYVDGSETDALLFGDMGTYVPYKTFNWVQYESVNTMKWLQRDLMQLGNRPTLVSHIGDISYARGYSWLWDNFFTQIEPVAVQAPYHVCIGNHEYDWPAQPWNPEWGPYGTDSGGECGVPYSLRFAMPGNSSLAVRKDVLGVPETKNLYYSIDFGVVHFVYFSTETNFLPGSDQYSWIDHDLKNVDRKKTPFVAFLGHRPMYSTDNKAMNASITKNMIEFLEPLLVENRVSLALWGHVHKYERTCPIQNSVCMDTGNSNGVSPIHIVIGMGGQDWQPTDQPRPERPMAPIFPQPAWSLFRSFEFGYIRLHATKSLMTISYIGNHDGQVHDMVEIANPMQDTTVKVIEIHAVSDDQAAKHPSTLKVIESGTGSGREPADDSLLRNWMQGATQFLLAFTLGAGVMVVCVYLHLQRASQRALSSPFSES